MSDWVYVEIVTNLVEKRFCIRHVVKDQKYLRRVDSKSFTRIAIAISCSHASIGASSSGTAVVGVSWEYSVIFSWEREYPELCTWATLHSNKIKFNMVTIGQALNSDDRTRSSRQQMCRHLGWIYRTSSRPPNVSSSSLRRARWTRKLRDEGCC